MVKWPKTFKSVHYTTPFLREFITRALFKCILHPRCSCYQEFSIEDLFRDHSNGLNMIILTMQTFEAYSKA
jgi:hypothetical protein